MNGEKVIPLTVPEDTPTPYRQADKYGGDPRPVSLPQVFGEIGASLIHLEALRVYTPQVYPEQVSPLGVIRTVTHKRHTRHGHGPTPTAPNMPLISHNTYDSPLLINSVRL